jgi:thioesterase domain-containing protein/acyl carrier protein
MGPAVAPRDYYENLVARLWEVELGVAPIGIDDDFFELGGQSITAVDIFMELEREAGIELHPSVLLEQPTPRAVANMIRKATENGEAPDTIVEIQGGETRPPFFLVHGLTGDVVFARKLALALGKDQPFLGIRISNRLVQEGGRATIEDLAEEYIAAVRSRQPSGPYILAGYCVGGPIVLEMAHRLCASGEDVPLICLFDSPYPMTNGALRRVSTRARQLMATARTNGPHTLVDHFGWLIARLLGRRVKSVDSKPPDWAADQPVINRHFYPIVYAYRYYRAKPYAGDAVSIVSQGTAGRYFGDDLGWGALIKGSLDIIQVPGDHGDVFDPPVIASYVDVLRQRLREAETPA